MTETTSAGSSLASETISEKPISDMAEIVNPSTHRKPGNLGMTLIGLGVLCCITGFVLMFNSSFGSFQFNLSLYGLTGAGGSSIMGGLFLLLG